MQRGLWLQKQYYLRNSSGWYELMTNIRFIFHCSSHSLCLICKILLKCEKQLFITPHRENLLAFNLYNWPQFGTFFVLFFFLLNRLLSRHIGFYSNFEYFSSIWSYGVPISIEYFNIRPFLFFLSFSYSYVKQKYIWVHVCACLCELLTNN